MRYCLVWVIWLTLAFASSGAAQSAPRNVLILYSFDSGFSSDAAFARAFRTELSKQSLEPINYFEVSVRPTPSVEAIQEEAVADYLRSSLTGQRLDLVVTISAPAALFARRYHERLFPETPVLLAGVDQRWVQHEVLTANEAAVPMAVDPVRIVEDILRLLPRTTNVFVVIGDSPLEKAWRDELSRDLQPLTDRLTFAWFNELSFAEMLKRAAALPTNSAIFYVLLSVDAKGFSHSENRALAELREVANAPIFGVFSNQLGGGVVGGPLLPVDDMATQTANTAARLLRGESAATIRTASQAADRSMYDWRELQRWGISDARLPAGSIVLFRPPGVWDQYKSYIVVAAALLGLQSALIAALLIQRVRRRETEARNSAILRAVPDLMFLQDKDGVYIDYHTPHPDQLFLPSEQFLGRHMRDVLPADLVTTLEPHLQRARESQAVTLVEYSLQMPDSLRHYEARIVPSGNGRLLSIVRDVTERKRADADLHESQERYALATIAGGVGVWDWNLETNGIFVDPSLKALLGFEDREIRNHMDDWGQRVHPNDAPAVAARAQAHLAGETPIFEVEHRMLHKDGSVRWFLARGSAVQRKDGKPVRIIGTDTDITERKQSDQQLQEAQADLVRVSRLTALGEFASSIAHEVSQPLTAIVMNAKTCLRWLASASPDMSEIRTALWDVVESAKRADEVIRRNRELFQHHTVEKAPVDVNAVIRDVAVLARTRLQDSHVALETDLADRLPAILGDRLELQQVLLNLIVNGIDAMETVPPTSRRLRLASQQVEDGGVHVEVRDTGVGLSGVDVKRMFSPSYTTKPAGTGVGLSICRSIIEAHGGRIWAGQNDGGGATFCFTLPVPGVPPPTPPLAK